MKKVFLIFLLSYCFQNYSVSQDYRMVDSLLTALKKHNVLKTELRLTSPSLFDTLTIDILTKIANVYTANDNDTAMQFAQQALNLAEAIGYKKGIGNVLQKIGWIYLNLDNYPEALKNLNAALKINLQTDNKTEAFGCYFGIGHTYLGKGDFPEALKNYFEALRIAEASGNKYKEAQAVSGIANAYSSAGNYAESKKYILRSIKISESLGNKYQLSNAYDLMANLYLAEKDYPHALENITKSLKLSEEINEIYSVGFDLYNIGVIYQSTNQISKATGYYFKSLKIAEDKGFKQLQISVLNSLGNIHLTQKNYESAYHYINRGLILSKQIGSLEQIQNSYENLVMADSAQGNFKEALRHYRLYDAMGDSIINNENTKKAMQVQLQYDFDKKHVADSLKFVKEKEIAGLKLQKQKMLTYGGFAGIAITVTLLYFLYRNFSKQRIANQKLKAAQQQLIKSEKMAAFGVVASRMAHEIQNPLNFVNNFSQLSQELVADILESQSEDEKKQHAELLIDNLQRIKEHGKRAADIVKQLEEHSSKGTAHEFFE